MRPWDETDDLNLVECADQGVIALCYLLRRTPDEVRERARLLMVPIVEPYHNTASLPKDQPKSFYELVELYGSVQAEFCPKCGRGIVVPWDKGGELGICPACYYRAQLDALELENTVAEIKREKNKVKQRTCRARRETGDSIRAATPGKCQGSTKV